MSIRQLWNRIVATKYTRLLEAEIGRLRAENRALLNSILGIAGIPPIVVASEGIAESVRAQAQVGDAIQTASPVVGDSAPSPRKQRPGNALARGVPVGMPPPVRHRSWQQVNRMLEFDSVRKREQDTGERSQV